ncbi:hypothetical protein Droror1_Dr00023564 [Drosera rotundifolia]
MLNNSGVMGEFESLFEKDMILTRQARTRAEVWKLYNQQFPSRLKNYVSFTPILGCLRRMFSQELNYSLALRLQVINNNMDANIRILALGSNKAVQKYDRYFINGFKFDTFEYGEYKETMN